MNDIFDYVAFKKPCGCIVGLCTDFADRETAKEVAKWIGRGLRVERMPLAQVRELLDDKNFGCSCEQEQPSLF